jgi:1,4-dihydroxy-2-naphthoyl-CoA synthase
MTEWTDWQDVPGVEFKEIVYQKKYRDRGGGVARLLFNRPQRMNAFTGVGLRELRDGLFDANADPNIGVIVIGSIGDHFGTGGDVQWESEGGLKELPMVPEHITAMKNCLKPIIAAVKGYCIGGHNITAYHCDFTIAADTAIFGQNGPRVASPAHGLVVGALAHTIGLKRARELWMLCWQYTAQQAVDMGLVNTVVPLDKLDEEVDRWCDELLDRSPCLAIVKQTFEAVSGYLTQESGRLLGLVAPDFFDRPEVTEAQRAFFEKRRPNFWPAK